MGPSGEGEKGAVPLYGEERRDSRAVRRVLGGHSEPSEACLEMMQVRERSRALGKFGLSPVWKIRFSWAANTPANSGSTNSG